MNNLHVWPRLFTCPKGEGFADDDFGAGVFNPVYSNRDNMIRDSMEGCKDCDVVDACLGPVEYAPVDTSALFAPSVPDGDACQRGAG